MNKKTFLILENGIVFEGRGFGFEGDAIGEVVFTTGMIGYIETLTDLSYHGQIVVQTFPLIGNYGIIPTDFESDKIGPSAYIVKHPCENPSNFRSEESLDAFLKKKNIVGLSGVDTRAITKIIREHGVMNALITNKNPKHVNISKIKEYKIENALEAVSVKEKILYKNKNHKYKVALLDFGIKQNIIRLLLKYECEITVFPYNSSVKDILSIKPHGIMLSNGPGDPIDNIHVIENLKNILKHKIPIFGICLGHQLLALASGFKTYKLKFGHRGTNQAVKDLESKRLYITSQNHGYAVCSESLDKNIAKEWFINVNDKTCEGLLYKESPVMSVQFHTEASSGPHDTEFLFSKFTDNMELYKNAIR